jgi:hypothetical protein
MKQMKNLIFIFVIAILLISCNRPKANIATGTQIPITSEILKMEDNLPELKKDRVLVYPILHPDSTLIDAYGYKIKYYFPQWYMVSTKIRALIPVNVHILDEAGEETDYPTPLQLVRAWGYSGVTVDTVDLSSFVPGLHNSVILNTGKYEITLASNNCAEIKRTH